MTKMTYAVALDVAINAVADNAEVREKLEALKIQLAKKSSAPKKLTKTQLENENFKTAILCGMEVNKPYTVTEITKAIVEVANLSNQRVSALMKQLADDGLVVRTEDKRKAYFTKVETED